MSYFRSKSITPKKFSSLTWYSFSFDHRKAKLCLARNFTAATILIRTCLHRSFSFAISCCRSLSIVTFLLSLRRTTAVEAHRPHIVGHCRQLRLLEGANPVTLAVVPVFSSKIHVPPRRRPPAMGYFLFGGGAGTG